VFESGAILICLAETAGRMLPTDRRPRFEVLACLMFKMWGVGPMLVQLIHFKRFAPGLIPFAIARYEKETLRLYGVLNQRLQDRDYVAGDYSIADIALYPWVAIHEFQGLSLDSYPHLAAWVARLAARPAVQRGMAVPS
ncbi:MAG: glutathione S-transferase family protein, partial [Gloeomargaritaceae cyanobacterium C42_A2020_066]|nr:glutathione S-transferase family protein [Gloeomargaritaceae cyanobacterium C42_A2020_066]